MKSPVCLPLIIFFLGFMLLLESEAMVLGATARGLEATMPYSPAPPKALESGSPPPPSPVREPPPPRRHPYRPPPPRVVGSPPIIPVHA